MGVFGGSTLTNTADHGGATDHKWPDFKELVPKQIAVPTGLSTLPSCTLGTIVHGDQQELIYKNRQSVIVLNDTLNVGINKTDTIEAQHEHIVKGGRLAIIGPTETLEVQGTRTLYIHGQDTEHYLTHREIEEPVERIEYKHNSMEYGQASAEAMATAFETKGIAIAIENIKVQAKLFKQTNEAIEGKITALHGRAEAMSTHIGALMLAAKARLNALVNWALSSPTS